MDKIFVKDLLLRAIIGINDWERREKQDVVINLELFCDLKKAGESDRIEDTVNYKDLTKKIIKFVEDSNFFTVEALASRIADLCLEDKRVLKVKVMIEKPNALRFAKSVGVLIERGEGGEKG